MRKKNHKVPNIARCNIQLKKASVKIKNAVSKRTIIKIRAQQIGRIMLAFV